MTIVTQHLRFYAKVVCTHGILTPLTILINSPACQNGLSFLAAGHQLFTLTCSQVEKQDHNPMQSQSTWFFRIICIPIIIKYLLNKFCTNTFVNKMITTYCELDEFESHYKNDLITRFHYSIYYLLIDCKWRLWIKKCIFSIFTGASSCVFVSLRCLLLVAIHCPDLHCDCKLCSRGHPSNAVNYISTGQTTHTYTTAGISLISSQKCKHLSLKKQVTSSVLFLIIWFIWALVCFKIWCQLGLETHASLFTFIFDDFSHFDFPLSFGIGMFWYICFANYFRQLYELLSTLPLYFMFVGGLLPHLASCGVLKLLQINMENLESINNMNTYTYSMFFVLFVLSYITLFVVINSRLIIVVYFLFHIDTSDHFIVVRDSSLLYNYIERYLVNSIILRKICGIKESSWNIFLMKQILLLYVHCHPIADIIIEYCKLKSLDKMIDSFLIVDKTCKLVSQPSTTYLQHAQTVTLNCNDIPKVKRIDDINIENDANGIPMVKIQEIELNKYKRTFQNIEAICPFDIRCQTCFVQFGDKTNCILIQKECDEFCSYQQIELMQQTCSFLVNRIFGTEKGQNIFGQQIICAADKFENLKRLTNNARIVLTKKYLVCHFHNSRLL